MGRLDRAALVVIALLTACAESEYAIEVTVPGDAARVTWVELAVIQRCADLASPSDAPTDALRTVGFRGGVSPAPIGALSAGRYGLQGRAWGAGCILFAAGCKDVRLEGGGEGTLRVLLGPADGRGCDPGRTCSANACVSVEGDAGGPLVDGGADGGAEDLDPALTLTGGWTATVFKDFTRDLAYEPDDFVELDDLGAEVIDDNRPRAIAATSAPWPDGLAIGTGRDLLTIGTDGHVEHVAVRRSESTGPDVIGELAFGAPEVGEPATLLAVSQSVLEGDGLFRIAPDGAPEALTSDNNCGCLAADPLGLYLELGSPQVYYCRDEAALQHYRGADSYAGVRDATILPDSAMMIVRGVRDEVRIVLSPDDPQGFILTDFDRETVQVFHNGTVGRRFETGYLIERPSRVVEIHGDGSTIVVAEALDPAWFFESAVIPEEGHALAPADLAIYLLETDVDAERWRVLRLTPP